MGTLLCRDTTNGLKPKGTFTGEGESGSAGPQPGRLDSELRNTPRTLDPAPVPHPPQDGSSSSGRSWQLAGAEGSLSHYRFLSRSESGHRPGVTTLIPSQELAQALPVCCSYHLPNNEQVNLAKASYQRRTVRGAQPTPASEKPQESLHPGWRREAGLVNAGAGQSQPAGVRRLHSPQKCESCFP